MKILYDEHEVILSVIEIAENSEKAMHENPDEWRTFCKNLIHFFSNYADKYHHYKEEEFLFPAITNANEVMGMNIIAEMIENHEDFRNYIEEIETSLETDTQKAFDILVDYCDELKDHIAAENEELFIAAETILTEQELETMKFRFQDIDRELGDDRKLDFENIQNLHFPE